MKEVLITSHEGDVIIRASNNKTSKELVNLARLYLQDRNYSRGINRPIAHLSNVTYYTPSKFSEYMGSLEEQGFLKTFEQDTSIIEQTTTYEYNIVYERDLSLPVEY